MHDSWLELVDQVLRPLRPRLPHCLGERERHRAAERAAAEERAGAIAICEARIERARRAVFDAGDGVIPSLMTDLEREWRTLSRPNPELGLMELWARIAPVSWIDRKRWRDSEASASVDAAIALAADVDGVEAAESAIDSLRVALAAWGTPVGARIRWRASCVDTDCVTDLLAAPHRAAREAVAVRSPSSGIFERIQRMEDAVLQAMLVRFPERPLLAQSLARARGVDGLLRAFSLAARPNPVTPLCELWKTGYTIAAIDASGVTLEIPPL